MIAALRWLAAWCVLSFDGGGGGSSSSSSQTTTSTDKRLVVDSGVGVSSDSSTVNVNALDGGSIAEAFKFADAVSKGNQSNVSEIIKLAGGVFSNAYKTLDKQAGFVDNAGQAVAKAYEDAKGAGVEKTALIAVGIAALAMIGLKAMK